MTSSILCFCIVYLTLVQILFLNGAQCGPLTPYNNATHSGSPWKSSRMKRSLADTLPNKLYIRVKLASNNLEYLVFMKTKQNLANTNLPVDAPFDYLRRNTVMNDIGEFVMYQNLKRCAAIVYFGNSKTIFGVIDTDYYIRHFPLEWNSKGQVMGILTNPYVMKREETFFKLNPNVIPFTYHEQSMDPQAGPSTQHDSINTDVEAMDSEKNHGIYCTAHNIDEEKLKNTEYYLETLVFISRGVAKIFYNVFKEDYINQLVQYYLVYFNAVDIFFQRLQKNGIKININIAKIVIEDDLLTPFEFINQRELQFIDLITQLPLYLRKYSFEYPPDSFDHVFIITDLPIMHDTIATRAITKSADNLISARGQNKFYESVSFTVIRAESYYSGYFQAIEEFGQVFNPNNNPFKYNNGLEWSQDNLNQFRIFFTKNPNRIFFRNKPRSLLLPGRHKLISTVAQCKCLGYDYYGLYPLGAPVSYVKRTECLTPLQCHKRGTMLADNTSVWPFDGTPCGVDNVCWAGMCMPATLLDIIDDF